MIERIHVITIMMIAGFLAFGQSGSLPLLSLLQDGKQIIVNDSDTIVLTRKPFSLRFLLRESSLKEDRYFSARVNVSSDNRNFTVYNGLPLAKTVCFRPGTGLSPDKTGHYRSADISAGTHHYIFFGESEMYQRADLVHHMSSDNVLLEWKVSEFTFEGQQYSAAQFPGNQLYLFFFIDQNRNEKLDQGEYVRLTVKLMP